MPVTDPQVQPYVGLRPYRRDESALFHGRGREAQEVATLWQAAGLTVLYGASGVGKTSLLHAGVLPLLDPEHADVLPVARIAPRMSKPATRGGNPYVRALLSCWTDRRDLGDLTIAQFLDDRPEQMDRYGDPVPILAAIDQAEEIFHGSPILEKERRVFLDQLAEAVKKHPGLHVLLALREEYLFLVLPHERRIGQGSRSRFHLEALSPEQALQVVHGPLPQTGRTMTPEAAELLIDDLREVHFENEAGETTTIKVDTVEPIQLQVVCSALWESLPPEVVEITEEHALLYAQVEEFLSAFYRRTMAEVAAEHGLPASKLRLWMRKTFITEHGTRNAVYEGLIETEGMPNAIPRTLEDRHLLRAEQRLGIRWYELTHDRLIAPRHQVRGAGVLPAGGPPGGGGTRLGPRPPPRRAGRARRRRGRGVGTRRGGGGLRLGGARPRRPRQRQAVLRGGGRNLLGVPAVRRRGPRADQGRAALA
ncbi:hypothetical protein [Nonomuraea salmonea]|uniref:nSTAND1 domain-containing NTPase n=1 Tax=Nonomuraea salmonea TaxID=46181 RepID=UPI002FEAC752